MFLYDTHVHTSECSACGKSTVREMVRAYKEAGYSGFALTNHFFHGNSAVNRTDTTWRDFVQPYVDAYYEACDEGAKCDFDVIFGIEEGVGNSKEMLCYNIDLDYLLNCEEMMYAKRKEFIDLVHAGGGIVIHAHPFRFAPYMKSYYEPYFDGCDGIEVYNGNNRPDDANEKAYQAALSQGRKMIMTAGSDCHSAECIRRVGLWLPNRVANAAEFVEALKSGDYGFETDNKMEIK